MVLHEDVLRCPGDVDPSVNCVQDFAGQLCPHGWSVGWDGDSCYAPQDYDGPCEPIWHGLAKLSSRERRQLQTLCRTRWACTHESPTALSMSFTQRNDARKGRALVKSPVRFDPRSAINFPTVNADVSGPLQGTGIIENSRPRAFFA